MNREILFRGKRMDNGEWVYGYYAHIPCGRFNKDEHLIQTIQDNGRIGVLVAVDPVTVGRYIGLTDKNGVKIFEGDIIAGEGSRMQLDRFVIRWNTASCGFSAGEGKRVWPNLNQVTVSSYEIIGNIHDNPELLEEAEKNV